MTNYDLILLTEIKL